MTKADTHSRPALLPVLAVTVTVLLWASAFVAVRHVGHTISPGALSLGRLLVGSVVLGAVVLFRRFRARAGAGGTPAGGAGVTAGNGWPHGRVWIRLIVCGVVWFGIYNVALNAGEQRIDAGTSAMLVNIGPILIAILSALVFRERFSGWFVAGAAIAFAGVVVIGVATSDAEPTDTWGVILCVIAAVAYAIGVLTQKSLLATVSALNVTWLACTVGAIVCLPFVGQMVHQFGHADASIIWQVVYLGAFPTALAFTTWAYALARTSAGRLGVTTYLVPVLATAMGWLFLGETPVAFAYVGGAMCLVGVGLSRRTRPLRRRRAASATPSEAAPGDTASGDVASGDVAREARESV